jgi:hypothetical protein
MEGGMTKQRRQRYGKYFLGKIGKDRVLAHNQVRHTADMHCGINGFRWWTWHRSQKPKHFVRCDCGWAGLPHFRGDFTSKNYRCDSRSAVRKYSGWTQTAMLECYLADVS